MVTAGNRTPDLSVIVTGSDTFTDKPTRRFAYDVYASLLKLKYIMILVLQEWKKYWD